MKRVAIYCGSRRGNDDKYAGAAAAVATALADAGIGIVYGGSNTGLMGVVADNALAAGGEVIGVIPEGLFQREVAHQALTDLRYVKGMHERKAMMAGLADAFIALPGGIGTLDELIEIWCWAGIGSHSKPCLCYDVDNYWQPLFDLLQHIHSEGFAHGNETLLKVSDTGALLDVLQRPA
ncbi:MAG: TIGR00730 family Rossman fold protein [Oceanospirillaceae bacterium]|nr:TIGR00730 family Rossman fold protein [Oceanospirillaceae bacterium]MBT13463.1 TIGR00730 family Rossman fold protein [Oceanospirillaceae bacterium]|tara:strand:+ start:115573 stop:116109 length:537 start_codon:yes stop_codon:yes gene_type:complete